MEIKANPEEENSTCPLHGDLGRWEWDQFHLSGYMVARNVYHRGQELHQHVHESKLSAVDKNKSAPSGLKMRNNINI